MWRNIFISLTTTAAVAGGLAARGQQREPYGPFDAVAEGTQTSELRRLSLVESQLAAVDRLRSDVVPVIGRRTIILRDPTAAAVYPYGRRGVLGLRPQGYVVVRRAPIVVYRRAIVDPQTFEPRTVYRYDEAREGVRQPIGNESLQTAPNRWEYRPLYAEDERRLDATHREIERNLRPEDNVPLDNDSRDDRTFQRDRRARAGERGTSEPEELPIPEENNGRGPVRRSDARQAADRDVARDVARPTTPPPPQPDPPDQPARSRPIERERAAVKKPPVDPPPDDVRGPLLQNPSTGRREF